MDSKIWFLLILLLISCAMMSLAGQSVKKMIENGKKLYNEEVEKWNDRKPLLILSFININNNISINNLLRNMQRVEGRGDWALIDYTQTATPRLCSPLVEKGAIYCKSAKIKRDKMKGIPKPLMYGDVLPILKNYKYVFVLDEDISFRDFNLSAYMTYHDCAFSPSPPPLVSQPLIAESTQDFNYLNYNSWKNQIKHKGIVAVQSPFIEQQVPYFNSLFFQWLIQYVLPPSFPLARQTESSWGPDNIWCGAAKTFASKVLGYNPKTYISCAIILKGHAIHHLNLHTIRAKKKNKANFQEGGFRMHRYFRSNYGDWFEWGRNNSRNPLHSTKFNFTRVYATHQGCMERYQEFIAQ